MGDSGLIGGRFRILGLEGRGEMGEVRRAVDEQSGAVVAVRPSSAGAAASGSR
jgi:hypothetical protein